MPHFDTSCVATGEVDLMGEVGVVVFLLGGWTLAPRRNLKIGIENVSKNKMEPPATPT